MTTPKIQASNCHIEYYNDNMITVANFAFLHGHKGVQFSFGGWDGGWPAIRVEDSRLFIVESVDQNKIWTYNYYGKYLGSFSKIAPYKFAFLVVYDPRLKYD